MYNYKAVTIIPSLALVLMGTLDLLTTVIGISHCGAIEANPVLSSTAMTNLPLFTTIKLVTTLVVGVLFYQAQKNLQSMQNKERMSFKLTKVTVRIAYVAMLAFLSLVVLNNLAVVLNAI